ncbi:MAG: type II secretion system protein GspE, partial [Desulfofustis sp.]|nr:type II secretion system protein GspE [Desulfofustis sp.]
MNDRMGAVLVSRAGLTEEALQQAYALQKKSGGKLGDILIRQKAIREMDLLQVLAEQFRMAVIPVLPPSIDTDFTKRLAIGFLKKNLIVPVMTEDDAYIAMHDPFDFQALDEVRLRLDRPACPAVLSPQAEIVRTINTAYDLTLDTAEEVMQDIDEEDADVLFSKIEEVGDLLDDTSHSPVIRLVNLMLSQAVRHKVSDIHIEPFQNSLKIRQRL